MDGFGRQIGREGHQQADQDLAADILAPATADEGLHQPYGEGDADADRHARQSQPGEGSKGAGQGKGAGRRRQHGDPHEGQAAGVVQQGLAFENVHQPLGDGRPPGDGLNRNGVRRRQDGRQGEGHGQRHGRDHPVDQKAQPQNGEDHQPQRQFQNHHPVPEQRLLGDAPPVDEQQRRKEQQEEDIRLQIDRLAGDQHHPGAQRDLHQRQGDARDASHPSRQHDGQQQEEDGLDQMHERISRSHPDTAVQVAPARRDAGGPSDGPGRHYPFRAPSRGRWRRARPAGLRDAARP